MSDVWYVYQSNYGQAQQDTAGAIRMTKSKKTHAGKNKDSRTKRRDRRKQQRELLESLK